MVLELSKEKKLYILHKVTDLSVSLSIKHLSIMLRSGLPLQEVLTMVAEQANDPKLQEVFTEVNKFVAQGNPLADALKKYPKVFSPIVISIIEVGEKGATLEKNLEFLADYLKRKYELNKKLKGALVYPMVIVVMAIVEVFGVFYFIIPQLQNLFSEAENLPPLTAAIMQMSVFLRSYDIFIFGGLAVFGFFFTMFLRTKNGVNLSQSVSIRFPIIKTMNRLSILANITRTLAILLDSGIPLVTAIEITTTTISHHEYKKAFKKVENDINGGVSLADALEKFPEYFPKLLVKMIRVGEETGSLSENLEYLHDYYSDEVEDLTENIADLLEPLLLMFIGIIVALLAIAVIGPIYQLTGTINDL